MAAITIKLSQDIVNLQAAQAAPGAPVGDSIGGLLDQMATIEMAIESAHYYYASWNLFGSILQIGYPDGATGTYTGVVLNNPTAATGQATATGWQFDMPSTVSFNAQGALVYDYVLNAQNALSFVVASGPSVIKSMQVATKFPAWNPAYDAQFGNVSFGISGDLRLGGSGAMSGTVTHVGATADKMLLSATIDGNFQVSGNMISAGQGYSHMSAPGTLTGYQEAYRDGSLVMLTGLNAALTANQPIDVSLLGNAAYFGGSDDISIDLPAHLTNRVLMASGDGNDHILVKDGGGLLDVMAGNGDDDITPLGDRHTIDGGAGLDVVRLAAARADVTVQRAGATAAGQPVFIVTDKAGVSNTLSNVERLVFANATVALDIDGNAGQAYRIYQAAFNRTPDTVGLGFWINALDHGQSLTSVADGFVHSAEFRSAYGGNPGNHDLVTQFYQNILHRTPDAGGLSFWVGALDTHAAGVPDVLAAISESAENKAGLAALIGNGFSYTPYG